MNKLSLIIISTVFLSSCMPSVQIRKTINEYDLVESQINLGDSKSHVLKILSPSQKHLTNKSWKKRSERYNKKGILVEIHYFRSALQSDGLTTDDEFTPYIFNNGKLVGIGWTMIGGPKSQGQARSTTSINVQQKTIVY